MSSPAQATLSGKKNKVPVVKQILSNWCWAACCEIFTKYYSSRVVTDQYQLLVEKFQEKLARRIHESQTAPVEDKGILDSAATPRDYLPYLNKLFGKGVVICKEYLDGGPRITKNTVMAFMDTDNVIICNDGNHATIICGYTTHNSEDYAVYFDPADASYKLKNWTVLETCTSLIWLNAEIGTKLAEKAEGKKAEGST